MRSELSLDLASPTTMPLEIRMAEFKQDPQKMDEMTKFIDELLTKAQEEADNKSNKKSEPETTKSTREGNNNVNIFNGLKRGRIVTRARGIVLRLFEAICNCTNSGPIPTPRTANAPSTSKF